MCIRDSPGAAEPTTLTASDLAASKSLVDTCAALLDSRTLYEAVSYTHLLRSCSIVFGKL